MSKVGEVEKYRWSPLELFKVIYPEDKDFDLKNLDIVFSGRVGFIYKKQDGSIDKIVVQRVWPHDTSDEEETCLYGPDDN